MSPKTQTISVESLLTERDVANILNVSVATIRRRRLLGQKPEWVKIGASVRYRPTDVVQFIQSGGRRVKA